jgi:AcrR family transcriptional regulator
MVGLHGYSEASVSRIVERAGLAQGTFYLYFESRQDLFDQLLPEVGAQALAYIRERVGAASDFMTVEERGMRAFFAYVIENPAYFRIFSEAEVAAPAAYKRYTSDRTGRFLDSITAAWRRGEIRGYAEHELGVLTQVMLAARVYLFQEYAGPARRPKAMPDWVIATYLKFIRRGIGFLDGEVPASGASSDEPRDDRPAPLRSAK